MSKNGKYTPEDFDFYTTLFVLKNFASVFKMDYDLVCSHCGLPVCRNDFDAVLIHLIGSVSYTHLTLPTILLV